LLGGYCFFAVILPQRKKREKELKEKRKDYDYLFCFTYAIVLLGAFVFGIGGYCCVYSWGGCGGC
jgi:hypothetical protein